MKVDVSPRRKNAGRPAEKSAPGFLQWLRGRQCFISTIDPDHACSGKVRACHFDPWGDKGVGTKVSDRAALPMCDGAHGEQHRIGWASFQAKYKFDGRHIVVSFWMQWPCRITWETRHG